MEILCLHWMGSDRQVDEADDCHYLENAPPVVAAAASLDLSNR